MFNPDAPDTDAPTTDAGAKQKKLPRSVIMMIEKGNLVMAIKNLAQDEKISMDAAKARIDAYEMTLKNKQQQKLNSIASKQGIPNSALSFDQEPPVEGFDPLSKDRVKSTPPEQGFKSLQRGVASQLDDIGYKKPVIPYLVKRVLIIVLIMAGLFWILWRVFA